MLSRQGARRRCGRGLGRVPARSGGVRPGWSEGGGRKAPEPEPARGPWACPVPGRKGGGSAGPGLLNPGDRLPASGQREFQLRPGPVCGQLALRARGHRRAHGRPRGRWRPGAATPNVTGAGAKDQGQSGAAPDFLSPAVGLRCSRAPVSQEWVRLRASAGQGSVTMLAGARTPRPSTDGCPVRPGARRARPAKGRAHGPSWPARQGPGAAAHLGHLSYQATVQGSRRRGRPGPRRHADGRRRPVRAGAGRSAGVVAGGVPAGSATRLVPAGAESGPAVAPDPRRRSAWRVPAAEALRAAPSPGTRPSRVRRVPDRSRAPRATGPERRGRGRSRRLRPRI